jgi:ubiquinone/menaquinone biosynthesis C-methylase UbiE
MANKRLTKSHFAGYKCVCGGVEFKEYEQNSIQVEECLKCGIQQQANLPFSTNSEYIEYYREYPPTKDTYEAKDYDHDRKLAAKRCRAYGIIEGNKDKILDVGSGSGAFVEECRSLGSKAYGCEISKYSYSKTSEDKYIYRERLEDINFPTDFFDKITCHDAAEHVVDPIKFIKEMFRILKQGGTCFIDLPRFHHAAGKHHWKPVEHIWFFNTKQFVSILSNIGFTLQSIKHPIQSKTVFYVTKPEQNRPTILLPPGMGDSFWSIVKMQAFIKKNNLGLPDVRVVCNRDNRYNGQKRSFPFLEMFPFLNSTGISHENGKNPKLKKIWREAYAERGRTTFQNIHGCNYFIAYNGHLKYGEQMENIDPDLECNWFPPMFVSKEQEHYKRDSIKKYGNYVVFYFPFYGTYKYWTQEFPIESVIESIKMIAKHANCTPIIAGAQWDADNTQLRQVINSISSCIDLTGKTSVEQLFGLIKGSKMVVGYPSGLTIMSTVLRQKTLIIWNDHYNKDFAWYSCPPDVRKKTYFVEFTKGLSPNKLANKVTQIITGKNINIKPIRNPVIKNRINQMKSNLRTTNNIAPIRSAREYETDITIMCSLLSGDGYSLDYLIKMRDMLARNITIPYKFVCLTDRDINTNICDSIKVENAYGGLWSKLEMFKHGIVKSERIISIDLSLIILKNIDDILTMEDDFIVLKTWNKSNWNKDLCAAGIMSWINGGTFSFIYEKFNKNAVTDYPKGERQYISKQLAQNNITPTYLQDSVKGVYSFKRNCKPAPPADTRIVCFHGKPKPHEAKASWIREVWK